MMSDLSKNFRFIRVRDGRWIELTPGDVSKLLVGLTVFIERHPNSDLASDCQAVLARFEVFTEPLEVPTNGRR